MKQKSRNKKLKKGYNHKNYIYAFNEKGNPEELKNSEEWKIHKKAFLGKWTQEEKNKIFERIKDCSFFSDGVDLMGVCFDFRPVLNEYWIELKYLGIIKVFAPNKTAIRNYYKSYNIFKIILVEKGDLT